MKYTVAWASDLKGTMSFFSTRITFNTRPRALQNSSASFIAAANTGPDAPCVPFLVRGPGVAPGKVPQAIHLQDAMATTLDLAGDSLEGIEFRSLLPLLRGESDQPTADPVYGAYLDLQRAILTGGWKLIAYPQARKLRLYHVAEDPEELHDLAAEPAQQDRLRQLFRQLQAAQQRLDDPLDLRPAFPDL